MIQERSVRTRKRLLATAAVEFSAHGYSGARLDAMVESIGMTKGALYGHFGSKQELATAVLEEGWRIWRDTLTVLASSSLEPACALRQLAGRAAQLSDVDEAFRAALRLAADVRMSTGDESVSLRRGVELRISELVCQAQQAGALTSAVEPGTLSGLVVAAVFAGLDAGAPSNAGRVRLEALWQMITSTGA
ncbi:TetR family transcriptional regulator [Streptomyces sp. NPDC048523]|uniref:TetR family transcriptional regulator n=1 Tax=Streptomyces sp. NPDC048523 TaxID=3365567 RepID=UPI003723877D